MTYSRRQLYALGEPLGDCVTRKEGGRIIYGGGGGGSSQPANTTQTATQELPEWAKPYAKSTLAKGEALTDLSQNPYQKYNQPRIAGFAPMQQQAMQGASNMDAGPAGFQQNVGAYMSPYMQNVVDVQKREAVRGAGIIGAGQQAKATQAGGFGGYREGVERGEMNRNLMTQMGDIQARGSQAAYDSASNQFRQGIGQGMDINKLQAGYGGMQQQQAQKGLDVAYQDFTNQQNYPYKQLGFMSDMIRGLPLGQQSTQSMYQAPPSGLQTMGALGLGAYGAKQLNMFAEGGEVQSYAPGGIVGRDSVTSEDSIRAFMSKLSVEQLQNIIRFSNNQTEIRIANELLQDHTSTTPAPQGISATASDQMVDNIMPTEASMARGGIVSFAEPTADNNYSSVTDNNTETEQIIPGLEYAGDEPIYQQALRESLDYGKNIGRFKPVKLTTEQQNAAIEGRFNLEKKLAGPNVAGEKYSRTIDEAEADRPNALSQGKGLAALRAMRGMVQGQNFVRGIGNAGAEFAEGYSPFLQADRKEKLALANMQFNLADAQRKERMGFTKSALAAAAEAAKDQKDANKFEFDKLVAQQRGAQGTATAARPIRAAGSGGAKEPKLNERLYTDNVNHLMGVEPKLEDETDTQFKARINAKAGEITARQIKDVGDVKAGLAQEKYDVETMKDARERARKASLQYRGFNRLPIEEQTKWLGQQTDLEATQLQKRKDREAAPKAGANPPAPPDISTIEGAPAGSKIGVLTPKGYQVVDSNGRIIGYAQ